MIIPIVAMLSGLLAGGTFTMLALAARRRHARRWAETEAADMIDGAKKDSQAQNEELNLQLEELKEEAWVRFENETRGHVQKNDEYSEILEERELKFRETVVAREGLLNRKSQAFSSRQQKLNQVEERVSGLRQKLFGLRSQLLDESKKRSSVPEEQLKQQIHARLEQEARTRATHAAQELEQEAQLNTERDA